MRPILILPLLIFLGLAAVFFGALRDPSGDTLSSALIGQSVPGFDLPPLQAGAPGLGAEDLKDGDLKLVNFWASWCAPCRVEHPILMAMAEAGTLTIHGINYKDEPEAAQRFLTSLGDPFTRVGVDAAGRTGIDFGVYGVPETFLIDGAGTILARHVGPLTPEGWEREIAPALDRARTAQADGARGKEAGVPETNGTRPSD